MKDTNITNGWRILQIVAAQPGWKAIYCQAATGQQVKISHRVIICWALVDAASAGDARRTEVRGVVQESNGLDVVGDSIATDNQGKENPMSNRYFLGYNDPEAHKESDYWIEQANLRLRLDKSETPALMD